MLKELWIKSCYKMFFSTKLHINYRELELFDIQNHLSHITETFMDCKQNRNMDHSGKSSYLVADGELSNGNRSCRRWICGTKRRMGADKVWLGSKWKIWLSGTCSWIVLISLARYNLPVWIIRLILYSNVSDNKASKAFERPQRDGFGFVMLVSDLNSWRK